MNFGLSLIPPRLYRLRENKTPRTDSKSRRAKKRESAPRMPTINKFLFDPLLTVPKYFQPPIMLGFVVRSLFERETDMFRPTKVDGTTGEALIGTI
jgi:hypothetical protein